MLFFIKDFCDVLYYIYYTMKTIFQMGSKKFSRIEIFTFVAGGLFLLAPLAVSAGALQPPLGDASTDPRLIAVNIINALVGILSTVTLVVFLYGGFLFLLSGGKSETIQKGKTTIFWAIVGLAIVLASYSISAYVFNTISGATKDGASTNTNQNTNQ